jgi:tRNA A37 threonylcarbamoyladenosine modification protein TsaB
MEKHLLVDCATPLIQVAIVEGGRIVLAKALAGNAADLISPLLRNLLRESDHSFEDFDGMIHCGGPGSVLGLRVAVISIKTWMIFSQKTFELLAYNTLDMCLQLNPQFDCVCTSGVGENLIAKAKEDKSIKITNLKNISMGKSVAFLCTRRDSSKDCKDFIAADYNIAGARFNILSICKVSTGELENYGSSTYQKWERGIATGKR